MRRLAAAAGVLLVCGVARADDTPPPAPPPPASAALKGFRFVLKPGFTYQKTSATYMPPVSQDITLTFSNHLGWAFPIGPIVLSPGASVPVWFFDAGTDFLGPGGKYRPDLHLPGATLGVLGELEVHVPLRYLSVYGLVGAGGAFFFGSNQQGGAFRGGGGITVFPAWWIGIGVQATYLAMSNASRGVDGGIEGLEIVWPVELRF